MNPSGNVTGTSGVAGEGEVDKKKKKKKIPALMDLEF